MSQGLGSDALAGLNSQRFRQFVVLDLVAAFAGVVTLTLVWVLLDADWLWPLWLSTAASVVLLALALRAYPRGRFDAAVFLVVASFWLMLVLATFMVPSIFGGVAVLMVWPVLFAVPYVTRSTLRWISVTTALVAAVGLPLALRSNPDQVAADLPSWVLNLVFVAFGAVFVGLSIHQVWGYSGRLTETLEGLQEANAALLRSELELEARVAARTRELELANADLVGSREETARARDLAIASSRELAAVLDNLADGLVAIDPEGRITRVNPALEDMVRVPCDELMGRPAAEALPWLAPLGAAAARTAPIGDIELTGDRVGKVVVSRITDADGQGHRGTVVLVSDVTVEREVDRMKTDFISTVSHELRTPLTSVLGFVKIIRKRLDERVFPAIVEPDARTAKAVAQVQDNLAIIVTEGERLATLINDVLDVAKMEAGRIEWRDDVVDINAVVDQAVAATTSLFEAKRLPLVVELASDLPSAQGDHHRLVQVLINLFSNAVKFTDDGSVTVRTALGIDGLVVSVTDTGPGIAPEDHATLFERFKQVGDTLTGKPQGTGLGVPICKEIVEHHGGRFTVDSAVGAGATFSFNLPVTVATAAARPLDATTLLKDLRSGLPRKGREGPATILVVDDHEPIRQLLRQELETEGYRVLEAADGQEAVRLAKELLPDIITLDVMMPGLDGFDVAAVLRSDPASMRIPIVMVSIVEEGERGRKAGVDRYLTKPIDTVQLLAEVQALLGQRCSHHRVVVVDEDATLLDTFRTTLTQQGWHVTAVSDREQAVAIARESLPDLVIANAALSTRISLVEALRAERETEHVVVVLFE